MIPRTENPLIAFGILVVALLSLSSVACSDGSYFSCSAVYRSSTLSSSKELFPGTESKWDMCDDHGRTTHFAITHLSKAGCESGEIADLYITKDNRGAYWGPTFANANDHWTMKHDPNGQWRAIHQDTYLGPGGFFGYDGETSDMLPTSGNPYVVIPAAGDEESIQIGTVNFTADLGGHTFDCTSGFPSSPSTWISKFSQVNVSTPFYTGAAVLNEEAENCDANPKCAIEKWYFSPGIGLVEIDVIAPRTLTTKRIN
jgi:hypothetical protein